MRSIFIALLGTAIVFASAVPAHHRIVGGHDTQIEEVPYQVLVTFFGYTLCGGTILNEKYVLTAASCTKDGLPYALAVVAGTNLVSDDTININVIEIYQHPLFNSVNKDTDISILELETPLPLGPKIQPAGLPNKDEEPLVGSLGKISGWGDLKFGGPAAKILQSTEVPIVSRDDCSKAFVGRNDITENMICAGYLREGGKDSCEFDTGGPLVIDGKVVGIISFGIDCGHPNYPGVYTNVAKYIDFITRIISK